MRGVYARILFAVVLIAPCVVALGQSTHWTREGSTNYWNNDSNWSLGIPTTDMTCHIRSLVEDGVEEHVTIQAGNTGNADWVRVGGPVLDEAGFVPLPPAHLTIEAGANLYWQANGDVSFSSVLAISDPYQATVHNYGTADGFEYWPDWEVDPWGPGQVQTPRISVGAQTVSGIDGGVGHLYCYDGSYTQAGALYVAEQNCKGYMTVYAGASVDAQFSLEIANRLSDSADCYGEFNLLGGSIRVRDTIDEEAAAGFGHHADIVVGKADLVFDPPGGIGVANLDAGYAYVHGDFVLIKGTVKLGKDLEFRVNDHWIVDERWFDHGYAEWEERHPDKDDILTTVEIDIDPATGVVSHPEVLVVWGDMHMGGHLYVENSGDRPKEGDAFRIWDGDDDEGKTHDGAFVSVTSNLQAGNAGYVDYLAVPSGDWGVEFTGLTGGDANGDHKVSIGDLSIMAGNWNQTGFTGGYADADFNEPEDGEVSIGDLSIMAGNWGWEHPDYWPAPAPIPEPATLSLLCLGGLALIRRKK